MPKFPEDPFILFTLQETFEKHGLEHLRVRKHGDLLVVESGPRNDPIRHLRMRRNTKQWYTLEIASHTGRWEFVPTIRAPANEILKTVIHQFPWMLTPIA